SPQRVLPTELGKDRGGSVEGGKGGSGTVPAEAYRKSSFNAISALVYGRKTGRRRHRVGPSGLPSLVCGGPRRRSLALTLGALGFRVQPTRGPDGARPGRRRRAIYELHSRRDEVDLRLTVATALGLYVEWRRQHELHVRQGRGIRLHGSSSLLLIS